MSIQTHIPVYCPRNASVFRCRLVVRWRSRHDLAVGLSQVVYSRTPSCLMPVGTPVIAIHLDPWKRVAVRINDAQGNMRADESSDPRGITVQRFGRDEQEWGTNEGHSMYRGNFSSTRYRLISW